MMAIKQTLNQKQKLILSQSMQQSLRVLQMDGVSLHEYLQDISLSNPLFELKEIAQSAIDEYAGVAVESKPSLYEYLASQVGMRYRDQPLRDLVNLLINYLDKDGFLQIDEADFCRKYGIGHLAYQDALTLLQSLDPAGVGAGTLQEALVLQAQSDPDCPPLVLQILQVYYDDFLHGDEHRILVGTGASVDDYARAKRLIGTFSARPGAAFRDSEIQYQVPDIRVRESESGFKLYLTKYGKPELVFNTGEYADLQHQVDEELHVYLQQKVAEYQSLSWNVHRREETLTAIAEFIVSVQWPYLNGQRQFIKPLILRDVANALGVSESTVSRTLSGEYIDSPRGIFAVAHLLTKRGQLRNEEGVDNEAIAAIRKIVKNESKVRPLSDQKIAEILVAKLQIKISRRTVAKYRSLADIPEKKFRKTVL
jgi:RNA polymerase sigma-54 factor